MLRNDFPWNFLSDVDILHQPLSTVVDNALLARDYLQRRKIIDAFYNFLIW